MRISINNAALTTYFRTVVERNAIYVRKEILKLPPPWTTDDIMATYRFCNVHRCLDTTYVLLEQLPGDKDSAEYWALRMMLRWTANNHLIKMLLDKHMTSLTEVARGDQLTLSSMIQWIVYKYCTDYNLTTGSFIVKRPGGPEGDVYMLTTYYNRCLELNFPKWKGSHRTIKHACAILQSKLPFCGSFTAYCLASDMMYSTYPLSDAPDMLRYAERGPGGVHGMATLLGHKDNKVSPKEWLLGIEWMTIKWSSLGPELVDALNSKVDHEHMSSAQKSQYNKVIALMTNPISLDVEHWLCEFFKYHRGSAKKKYKYEGVTNG